MRPTKFDLPSPRGRHFNDDLPECSINAVARYYGLARRASTRRLSHQRLFISECFLVCASHASAGLLPRYCVNASDVFEAATAVVTRLLQIDQHHGHGIARRHAFDIVAFDDMYLDVKRRSRIDKMLILRDDYAISQCSTLASRTLCLVSLND